jgi:hypothetical protein
VTEIKETYLIEFGDGFDHWKYLMATTKNRWKGDLKLCRKNHKHDHFRAMRYVSVETSERLD